MRWVFVGVQQADRDGFDALAAQPSGDLPDGIFLEFSDNGAVGGDAFRGAETVGSGDQRIGSNT